MSHGSRRWIAALAALALLSVAGCGTDDGDDGLPAVNHPPTVDTLSDQDLVQYLGDGAQGWLQRQLGIALLALACPNRVPNSLVTADSTDARGCLLYSSATTISVRIQNVSRVPMTVYFGNSWASIPPGTIRDYVLLRPAPGQYVRYRLDANTAASAALVSFLSSGAPPAVEWKACVTELTADCLISGLQAVLPPVVHVGRFEVPVGRILLLVKTVWTYAPLATALHSQISNNGEHRLTLG